MLKKLACIGLGVMIVITLSGCGKENKINEYDKEDNINIANVEIDESKKEYSEENDNEIITLCYGVPFNHNESSTYIEENEAKAGEDLTKYEIQYMNYDVNATSPYLSTGKVEKFHGEYSNKECFLVKDVGTIAVSANVKPIEVKLEQVDEIPEKVFSLNSDLQNYDTFKLYSAQLKSKGDKNYILEANYRDADGFGARGKLIVLDSQYNHLATLQNTVWSNCTIENQQIVNLDFDEDLEIVVFNQGINSGGGALIGIFNFVEDKLLGDTMDDRGA